MPLDQELSDALAALNELRELYQQHRQAAPWNRDEALENQLTSAWATVQSHLGSVELVIPVVGAPQCDVGAPSPVLTAETTTASVVYDRQDGQRSLLTFRDIDSVLFGGSNDEALHGHRLWNQGLEAYTFQEVINSTWIAQRESENAVHEHHRSGWHARLRHFIFTFHDETLECIAASFDVDDWHDASPAAQAARSM